MAKSQPLQGDVTVDVRHDRFVVLFPDDDDPRHDLVNTSFYVRRSAHLPHLGAIAEHEVIETMEALRHEFSVVDDH